jgi:hypothetical protein
VAYHKSEVTRMNTTTVNIAFPGLDGPAANKRAEDLLSELKQNSELKGQLNVDQTSVKRTRPDTQDFGVTLIAVLGTPAIIILAKAIKSWADRTGTTTIELNGVRITNVRSEDTAAIVKALESGSRI